MDKGEPGVECRLVKLIRLVWSQRLDELAHHDVNKLVGQGIAESLAQTRTMRIKIGRRRQAFIVVSRRLSNTWRRLSSLCYPLNSLRLNQGGTLDRILVRRTLKTDGPATGRLHGDTDCFRSTYSLGHDPYRGLIVLPLVPGVRIILPRTSYHLSALTRERVIATRAMWPARTLL